MFKVFALICALVLILPLEIGRVDERYLAVVLSFISAFTVAHDWTYFYVEKKKIGWRSYFSFSSMHKKAGVAGLFAGITGAVLCAAYYHFVPLSQQADLPSISIFVAAVFVLADFAIRRLSKKWDTAVSPPA